MVAALLTASLLQQPALPPLIPMPAKVVRGLGHFEFDARTRFSADGQARRVVEPFRKGLAAVTGFELPYSNGDGENVVSLRLRPQLAHLGREGYAMEVSSARIRIEAPTTAGLLYATETLRQLLPTELESDGPHPRSTPWRVAALVVEDSPRFEWRGLHLDVSRHFFPVAFIKRTLDSMALLKLNTFHWHLVDDGGWRIQIKKYPRLTRVGAWRKAMPEMWAQGKVEFPEPGDRSPRYGGFYTQGEVREVVAYAAERNIVIVPEIEMPGHSMPAMAAYPEVSCDYFAQTAWKIATGMHHPSNYCPGKGGTFVFLQNVLDEIMQLFPSKIIHIGGDEVSKLQWNKCASCAARMTAEKLPDADALQSWFLHRIESYLNGKGRSMMGWDEILEGGLAPNAEVMSWRGEDGGIAAAKAGHRVVMTPTSHCYFDHGYDSISTRKAFEYEPIPAALTEAEGKLVRGAQANVWTEWMPTEEKVETMIFPRLLGMAERLWSPASDRDADAFLARADAFLGRLDAMGRACNMPLPQPSEAAMVLSGGGSLSFAPSPTPGALVRYAVDGSDPTVDSPAFDAAIALTGSGTVVAATFAPSGRRSDFVRVPYVTVAPRGIDGLVSGLELRHATGTWSAVPDLHLEGFQPVARVDGSAYAGGDNYALEWTGYVRIPVAGRYTFSLGSDDGSVLWIAGMKVVDNDGVHAYWDRTGTLSLDAGVYAFKLGFFEVGEADRVSLEVQAPGAVRGPVPAEWWFRPGGRSSLVLSR